MSSSRSIPLTSTAKAPPPSSTSTHKAKVMTLRIVPAKPKPPPRESSSEPPASIPYYLRPSIPQPKAKKLKPFHFLDLPPELRFLVYHHYFANTPATLDLDPQNFRQVARLLMLLRTCRTIYQEATHYFYSTHTVRVFPCHPGRFFKTNRPLLARLKPKLKSHLMTLEVRLGPGWSQPPRGWVVNERLGLPKCTSVWKVRVFVECDPGQPHFKGFRQEGGFFERFSENLVKGVIGEVPNVRVVEFDGWPSVQLDGELMQGLIKVVKGLGMAVTFGPERRWGEEDKKREEEEVKNKRKTQEQEDEIEKQRVGLPQGIDREVERLLAKLQI